jgi:SAM-dependent methyltransferase
MGVRIEDVDEGKLEELQGKMISEVAGSAGVLMAYMGDQLGLYSALAEICPATSQALADKTGLKERNVREWLAANTAGGYIEYDPASQTFSMTPEQALIFAAEGDPNCMQGFFQATVSAFADEDRTIGAIRAGVGVPWGDHSACLFCGIERLFRPMYAVNLVENWIPALDGVKEKLESGAKVADVGCGYGSSTVIMAQAFPNSIFHGFDYHEPSIEQAKERARAAGVASNTIFEVVTAKDYPGEDYDLVTIFDALHDMGDPVGACKHVASTLAEDGTLMLVEPFAEDNLEDNLNPMAQIYYSSSTTVCVPNALSQEVGLALGNQAGEKRLTEVLNEGGLGHVRRAAETPTNMVLEVRV